VRILLDENMPESLRVALRRLGHQVDSVASLRLKGLDNGRLYREVARDYDFCFTKDRRFLETVRAMRRTGSVRVIRVRLRQAPGGAFTRAFLEAFRGTDWTRYPSGSEWPPRP
jgi:hypothetical protein